MPKLRGDEFRASGNSEIYGTDLTFYLTERNGSYATIDLTATVMVNTAPELTAH